jgi:hypothetical protein
MPDLFMDLLIRELNSISGEMKSAEGRLNGLEGVIDGLWISINPSGSFRNAVAVDGGLQEVKLANGHLLSMARAIAVNNMGMEPIRVVKVALFPESSPGSILTMSTLEVKAALEAINRYGGLRYVLMDGSLFVKLLEALRVLLLGRSIGEVYAIPEAVEFLSITSSLLTEASRRGVRLIFVSKDTNLRVYKEYAILRELAKSSVGQVSELASEGLNYYSVTWSRRLRLRFFNLMRRLSGTREASLMGLLLNQSVSDITLLASSTRRVGISHGMVKPMVLSGGLSPWLSELSDDELVRMVKRKLNDSLTLRGVEPSLDPSVLFNLPQVALTYVSASMDDSPMLVEVPIRGEGFLKRPRFRELNDTSVLTEVAGLMLGDYVDPVRYNGLLTLAHVYANFTVGQLGEYIAMLQDRLGLRFSRRLGLAVL